MDGEIPSKKMSLYIKGLPIEARGRYYQKLAYDKETKTLPDPYGINNENWVNDPCLWPELEFGQVYTYLIETPSLFSPTSMKAYKSLEAYR
jgi:hypothetical protein